MRTKLLSLLAMVLMTVTASAQWTAPTMKNVFTPVEPQAGETYMVYNVASGHFLTGAGYWGAQASLTPGNTKTVYPTQFELQYTDEDVDGTGNNVGWTIKFLTAIIHRDGRSLTNLYMFRDSESDIYLDKGNQGNYYWALRAQGNGYYRIQLPETNTSYGQTIIVDGEQVENENYDKQFVGWRGEIGDMLVYANVDPAAEGAGVDWAFVNPDEYTADKKAENETAIKIFTAKKQMLAYAQVAIAENLTEYGFNYEDYTAVYNSDDLEALEAAAAEMGEKIIEARKNKAWALGTEENPSDVTFLIVNPNMSDGTHTDSNGKAIPDGWTVEVPGAANYGYQGASYPKTGIEPVNGATLAGFIEAWCPSSASAPRGLGNGRICQTVQLPKGKYILGVDVIATNQAASGEETKTTVSGLQLYALGGGIDNGVEVSSENEIPEHFEFEFITAGGETELGLRMVNTTANWFGADNFTLKYKGNDFDPYLIALPAFVNSLANTYDALPSTAANQDVIAAFETAYENAQAAVNSGEGDFEALYTALFDANEALKTSVADYVYFQEVLDLWMAKAEKAVEADAKWEVVSSTLSDMIYEYQNAHDQGTFTREQIDAAAFALSELYANEIGKHVSKGDDLSFLLENPGFDGNTNGWNIDADAYTIKDKDGQKIQLGGYPVTFTNEEGEDVTLNSAVCEVWRNSFSISQTIKNMPAGLYTLSAQAFVRDEDAQDSKNIGGEFFAIMGEDVQTAPLKSIHDEATPAPQDFTPGEGAVGQEADRSASYGYIPNGRCGANVRFALGQYKNFFDIELKENSDIVVGVRNQDSHFWTLFDDFKIVYKGNDAEAYKETIQRKLAELEAMLNDESNIWTNEAFEKVDLAQNEGQNFLDALNTKTSEEALAMRDKLDQVIAEVKASLAQTAELKALWIEYSDYRMEIVDSEGTQLEPTDQDYADFVTEQLYAYLSDDAEDIINTDADVLAYKDKLIKGYTAYVLSAYSDVSEENPADITAAIYNPDCMGYGNGAGEAVGAKGWDVTAGKVGYGSDGASTDNGNGSILEFYETNYDIHQTIYGLVPGFYVLGVDAFYRDGNSKNIENVLNGVEGAEEHHYAQLYAGKATTNLLLISDCYKEYTEIAESLDLTSTSSKLTLSVDGEEETYYIPNTVYAAQNAFSNDLYKNKLLFEVTEGMESVNIGMRKTHNGNIAADEEAGIEKFEYFDWTPFNNWTLTYYGATAPSEDPTTYIQNVDVEKPATKLVIYNLAGQRVQKAVKGLYIINGKKVLVK